jgi:hypothetical protein
MSSTALISVTFLSVLMASKLLTVTVSKECVREKFADASWVLYGLLSALLGDEILRRLDCRCFCRTRASRPGERFLFMLGKDQSGLAASDQMIMFKATKLFHCPRGRNVGDGGRTEWGSFQTCLSCKLNQNLMQDIVYRKAQHFFFLSL